eukprot:scaffold1272_cov250-Pinguiococcus_pyrenoidosus.AAC.32
MVKGSLYLASKGALLGFSRGYTTLEEVRTEGEKRPSARKKGRADGALPASPPLAGFRAARRRRRCASCERRADSGGDVARRRICRGVFGRFASVRRGASENPASDENWMPPFEFST